MSFPRYPAYKPSGVEWLGEVPEHWEITQLKWQTCRNDGGVWGLDPDGESTDTIVLRSTEQTVDGKWQLDEPATRSLSPSEKASSVLTKGDLVITKSSGSSAHIGKTTIVTEEIAELDCCYSNFMQRLRLTPSFNPMLAWHALNNRLIREQFDFLSNSTTGLANLNGTMIGQVLIPLAPRTEQDAIATFLDRETAKIDALIAEQQRLIGLLQEKRQAVISHAVTKGLNPNAPMKDSGVEWLGEVPEHWKIMELKRLNEEGSSITYGIVQAGPHQEQGIPYIRTSDMSGDRLLLETCQRTSAEIDEAYARSRVREGDLVIAIRATVGKALEVPRELEGANLTQGTAKFSPGQRVSSGFMKFAFASSYCQAQIGSVAKGATFLEITLDALRRLIFAVPTKDELNQIAQYLSEECAALDILINQSDKACSLLKERRSALISAAVTGQIDVRGLATEEEP
jgi:type I restriction enzyme, S subunit